MKISKKILLSKLTVLPDFAEVAAEYAAEAEKFLFADCYLCANWDEAADGKIADDVDGRDHLIFWLEEAFLAVAETGAEKTF